MNTLHKDKDQVYVSSKLLPPGKARDAKCPLLAINGSTHREVEQHRNAPHDLIPVDLLGHLVGPVSFPQNSYLGCALFTGLDRPKGEICRHYDSIQPLVIYQS